MNLDTPFVAVLGVLAVLIVGRVFMRANGTKLSHSTDTGTMRGRRTYDGGRIDTRELHRYQQPDALTVCEPEPEGEAALGTYQPQPAPAIVLTRGKPIDRDPLPVSDMAPSWVLERREPHRMPSLDADFRLPMAQALGTALACGVGTTLIAAALSWSWQVPAFVAGASFCVAWFWRLRLLDGLLWKIESITRQDISGDGVAGQPTTPPAHAYTLANPAEARAEAAIDVRQQADNERRAELIAFLDRCLLVGCSESAQGIKASDRADYLRLREVLFQLGIAAWKNPEKPKAGWGLVVSHERARQIIARHVL